MQRLHHGNPIQHVHLVTWAKGVVKSSTCSCGAVFRKPGTVHRAREQWEDHLWDLRKSHV